MEIAIVSACIIIYFLVDYCRYIKTSYYKITQNNYFSLRSDKGKYGEYLIYKAIRAFERDGCKLLFNLYIPKESDQTTEIDVILVSRKGIFVIESKNFNGWIFGNESNKYWTQTLPRGRGYESHKEKFYNPILQNGSHLRYLKKIIGESIKTYSVVAFSDTCRLMDVTVRSKNVIVTNYSDLNSSLQEIYDENKLDNLNERQIEYIYNMLYLYSQSPLYIRELHNSNLSKN